MRAVPSTFACFPTRSMAVWEKCARRFSPRRRSGVAKRSSTRFRSRRYGPGGSTPPEGLRGSERPGHRIPKENAGPGTLLRLKGFDELVRVGDLAVLLRVLAGVGKHCPSGMSVRDRPAIQKMYVGSLVSCK